MKDAFEIIPSTAFKVPLKQKRPFYFLIIAWRPAMVNESGYLDTDFPSENNSPMILLLVFLLDKWNSLLLKDKDYSQRYN
jgi:hypothetical protein